MSIIDRLFRVNKSKVIADDRVEICKDIQQPKLILDLSSEKFAKKVYHISNAGRFQNSELIIKDITDKNICRRRIHTIKFESIRTNIKIIVTRDECIGNFDWDISYHINVITFKDEVIFEHEEWLCDGPIKQGVYDEIERLYALEKEENLRMKRYEKYQQYYEDINRKYKCKRINEEFLQLKNGVNKEV
jgi:hypothetical protein